MVRKEEGKYTYTACLVCSDDSEDLSDCYSNKNTVKTEVVKDTGEPCTKKNDDTGFYDKNGIFTTDRDCYVSDDGKYYGEVGFKVSTPYYKAQCKPDEEPPVVKPPVSEPVVEKKCSNPFSISFLMFID